LFDLYHHPDRHRFGNSAGRLSCRRRSTSPSAASARS